jgi:hypothetical protein
MSELDLKGNLEEFKKILLYEKNCIAFLGAGISKPPSGTWTETVYDIARYCQINSEGEVKEIIDKCAEKKPVEFDKKMRELFPKHPAVARSAINHILRLPFEGYVTTNFDPWFQVLSTRDVIDKYYIYPSIPFHEGISKKLYCIHGVFDSEDSNSKTNDLVFGKKSFEEAYGMESLLPGFLLNLFIYNNVLFIGFNPREEYISGILQRANRIRTNLLRYGIKNINPFRRFVLWDFDEEMIADKKEKWKSEIEGFIALELAPVIYHRRGADYHGLEEILYSWIKEGDLKNRSPKFDTGFKES